MKSNDCNFGKKEIGKNIFVYTRDLLRDYDWILVPNFVDKYILEKMMFEKEREISFNIKSEISKTEWFSFELAGVKFVFRIVRDGRMDNCGRLIRRYEGTILDKITEDNIAILEECLKDLQKVTNNYNYGWKNIFDETEEKSENCNVKIEGAKVVVKSEELSKFIKENSSKGVPCCFVMEVRGEFSNNSVETILVVKP